MNVLEIFLLKLRSPGITDIFVGDVEEFRFFKMDLIYNKIIGLARNPCLVEILPEDPMRATQVGMFLQKNSPFTSYFE